MKKGSLSLSVNAIVVMVIAFVVLGLILTFTRQIFQFGTSKTGEIFESTRLEAQPTPENPITLPDTIDLKKGTSKTLTVGFYNTNDDTAEKAQFVVIDCLDEEGDSVDNDKPTMISPKQDVSSSDIGGYKIIIRENENLNKGTYICTIAVSKDGSESDSKIYESKQVFLNIVS